MRTGDDGDSLPQLLTGWGIEDFIPPNLKQEILCLAANELNFSYSATF